MYNSTSTYRTRTYIAGDWDGDSDAIQQLYKWNDSNYWNLHFIDAHELTQARDSSLNCTIKRSLKDRMDSSKTFVLIVGDNTDSVKAGSCQYCDSYSSYWNSCRKGNSVDYRSYVQYECEQAIKAKINIIVLYNFTTVNKSKCPEILRDIGIHVAMKTNTSYFTQWDYHSVRKAFEDISNSGRSYSF